jgi:hypothetical protein
VVDPSGARFAQEVSNALRQPFQLQLHIQYYAKLLGAPALDTAIVDNVWSLNLHLDPLLHPFPPIHCGGFAPSS